MAGSKIVCNIAGCERKHAAKGFCSPHYARWKAGYSMDAPIGERRRGPSENTDCSIEGCLRPFYARDCCKVHYQRLLDGKPMVPVPKPVIPCRLEWCGRQSTTKGLCPAHYQQEYAGKEFRPVRAYMLTDVGAGRNCKTCGVFKSWDHYYSYKRRTKKVDGSTRVQRFTICKPCFREAQRDRELNRATPTRESN